MIRVHRNERFIPVYKISDRGPYEDWLVLQMFGNRRARFEWDESGQNAKWLIP